MVTERESVTIAADRQHSVNRGLAHGWQLRGQTAGKRDHSHMSSTHSRKSSSAAHAVLPAMPDTKESRWRSVTRERGSAGSRVQ